MFRKQPIRGAGSGSGAGFAGVDKDWLRLFRRRVVVACKPRNIAKFLGAVLVAGLLILLVTKGVAQRRRGGACRCAKFTYSQCQPYEGACGPGVKKAFCQQKRCQPRRKLVRCSTPCAGKEAGAALDEGSGNRIASGACVYGVRRQSLWSRCTEGANHRSRILFLQTANSAADCPLTKTERRSCRASKPRLTKKCIYEPNGVWSACDHERNAIVNTRKLIDGTVSNCPVELKTTMRCVKRDGSMKCIYSKWSKWSKCDDGIRLRTRSLIQGTECDEITRMVQNCAIPAHLGEDSAPNADSAVRK